MEREQVVPLDVRAQEAVIRVEDSGCLGSFHPFGLVGSTGAVPGDVLKGFPVVLFLAEELSEACLGYGCSGGCGKGQGCLFAHVFLNIIRIEQPMV